LSRPESEKATAIQTERTGGEGGQVTVETKLQPDSTIPPLFLSVVVFAQMNSSRAFFLWWLFSAARPLAAARVDTSGWIGAEYTPAGASNSLWWSFYDSYEAAIVRELG
jgi:hypothetical protein